MRQRRPSKQRQALLDLQVEVIRLQAELDRQSKAHAVLMEREWFTVVFEVEKGEIRHLFVLNKDSAHSVCSIGEGDVLLVGRKKRKAT